MLLSLLLTVFMLTLTIWFIKLRQVFGLITCGEVHIAFIKTSNSGTKYHKFVDKTYVLS